MRAILVHFAALAGSYLSFSFSFVLWLPDMRLRASPSAGTFPPGDSLGPRNKTLLHFGTSNCRADMRLLRPFSYCFQSKCLHLNCWPANPFRAICFAQAHSCGEYSSRWLILRRSCLSKVPPAAERNLRFLSDSLPASRGRVRWRSHFFFILARRFYQVYRGGDPL